jgi:hypothetical protein
VKKVPAFTFAELLVVIVLTLFLARLSIGAYQFLSSYFSIFDQEQEQAIQQLNLVELLQRDLEFAEHIHAEPGHLQLQVFQQTIHYRSVDTQLIRYAQHQIRPDTFSGIHPLQWNTHQQAAHSYGLLLLPYTDGRKHTLYKLMSTQQQLENHEH